MLIAENPQTAELLHSRLMFDKAVPEVVGGRTRIWLKEFLHVHVQGMQGVVKCRRTQDLKD